LLLPAWDACRAWIGEACDAPLDHPRLRRHLQERLAAMEARGSSERLIRAAFLREPLSLAAGEVTDKGSINARTVADRRSALVDALYADPERVGAVVLQSVAAG
jgi:feruloyl-CoA synthase